ncbi:E3 ubiquitin-protein ligase BRE1 Ecym_3250 [Eremothecium cymbalariae DBVPG|uniref:E3 ubiquitin protein ligase n=1 Tax=Eremothecium cymbalariae (strain CBS 270.75 / DBVPG 7215 / KCTC 17166 / NRRL Y-17582) TaxID=931890 RepID=G8JRH4_ERECY|nr:Hypothetical protein Ecym_3250 [Eremothecium cymbalariae DBVPG\
MTEPPAKRVKLELSNPSEPLTQKDVILFQKEALFRSLNQYRSEAKVSQIQVGELRRLQDGFNERLSAVCGGLRSIARLVVEAISRDDEVEDQSAVGVCEQIIMGDDAVVVECASSFTEIVGKVLGWGGKGASIDASQWQELEVLNSRLSVENKQLRAELDSIRSYYSGVLRQYDREDSVTVKRVFKLDEDGVQQENLETKTRSPKTGSSVAVAMGQEESSALASPTEDKVNGEPVNPQEENSLQLEHELQVADFQAEIQVLEDTVKELSNWKDSNQQEIVKLRQLVGISEPKQSQNQQQPQQSNSITDSQVLVTKIDKLSEENKELQQLNDAYLSKFQQLSADREVFTNKLSTEFQTAQETLKKHNSNLEKDLVRIRTARDELLSKIAVLEAQKSKSEILKDLESMLQLQEEQINKLNERRIEPSKDALMKELQDLEKAFKELSQYSNKKYSKYINHDSLMSKLTVEKTKADQKYFAAMRSKDSILIENKNLSKNLNKSNELIQQLKDIEKTLQSKIENLNKQLQISQVNEKRLIDSNKVTSLKIMDLTSQLTKCKKASASLQQKYSKSIEDKSKVELRLSNLEIECKNLQTKLTYQENKSKKLHKALVSNGGDNGALAKELENFRTVVYCSLCSKNWKDTAIKTCGHVFCADCCKERLAARMRKCPTCNKAFSSNDLLVVHL